MTSSPATNQSGERALELDLAEFEEREVPTKRKRTMDNIEELRTKLRRALAFSATEKFEPAEFAESIIFMSKPTYEMDQPNMYYVLEDKLGNQFRLYVDPQGKLGECVDISKRVVLEMEGELGYLFRVSVENDPRSE